MKKFFLFLGILILAVVLIGGVYVYLNKDRLAGMAMEKSVSTMENVVLKNLPSSVSPDSARSIFAHSLEKIKAGQADNQEMQKLALMFQSSYNDKTLDSLEVVNLLSEMDKLGSGIANK